MKKLLMIAGFVCLTASAANATKTTTTTTTTVFGKNTGTTVTGNTVTINCDNFYTYECYSVTTTTTTETNALIHHGDDIIITTYDGDGRNPQVVLEGQFDWTETTRDGTTFAVL